MLVGDECRAGVVSATVNMTEDRCRLSDREVARRAFRLVMKQDSNQPTQRVLASKERDMTDSMLVGRRDPDDREVALKPIR